MSNRLAGETSPYLLQHAGNLVDWQPWGEQALAQARSGNRPILLSIGYSACHWCHVMAHECFEDEAVAGVMNRLFVNIKVDREERPDLDHIYQTAHQMLTGRPGGWPLTVFLTPDGAPFFAGTYFPRTPRHGLPAFPDLCERVAEAYRQRPDAIEEQNRSLCQALAASLPQPTRDGARIPAPITETVTHLLRAFDSHYGGFGAAPKFPHATDLALLMRQPANSDARNAALLTLTRMAEGGLYDQLGGGFYRYSVDERWEIPHFEKMLYDNAMLLGVYADAWALTGEPLFARVVEETVAWTLREMQLPGGGFASSLDADSEGEEGRFYVWHPGEARALLTEDEWRVAGDHWGLDGTPNFENRSWHLHIAAPLASTDASRLASARDKLFAHRERRVRPGRDDKVLTAWNALMIEALTHAARIFDRPDWLGAARRALDFVLAELRRDGRLLATWRGGRAHLGAYLDDHAFLLAALIEMLQADFRVADLVVARQIADTLLVEFEDAAAGGFHFTSHRHERLIHRPKPMHDNSLPAGNAVAALALSKLGRLVGEARYVESAARAVQLFGAALDGHGVGAASLLMAMEEDAESGPTVVLRGPLAEVHAWSVELARRPLNRAVALPLAESRADLPCVLDKPIGARVNAWVCSGVTCLPPIADLDELHRVLR